MSQDMDDAISNYQGPNSSGLSQAISDMAVGGGPWDSRFAEILENHVLQHLSIIQPRVAVGSIVPGGLKLHSEWIAWGPLRDTLSNLGFAVGSVDHWHMLGA